MTAKRVISLSLSLAAAAALTVSAFGGAASARPSPSTTQHPVVRMSAAQGRELAKRMAAGTLSSSYTSEQICRVHKLACQAEVLVKKSSKGSAQPAAFNPDFGYSPAQLAKAYGVSSAPAGSGTIVVIGAGAYPTLESDLGIYRSTYGLPACTTANGCFKQINFTGGKPYAPAKGLQNQFGEEEIAVETSLDVDMASAACPGCKIISMQVPLTDGFYGNTQHIQNAIHHFAIGVATAHRLGAAAVSISYGYPTSSYSDSGTILQLMTHKGMPIVSSSGDDGATGHTGQWPQSLPTVTSAGGTSLYPDKSSSRGYTEVAWNGAGSSCTNDFKAAEGQPKAITKLCHGFRAASDLSAVADPYTGPSIYDSYAPATGMPLGFTVVGGTSVASPYLAGLYARAGSNPRVLGPNTIYAANKSVFNDVTLGTNYGIGLCYELNAEDPVCDAGPGWDGPTGRGTPTGLATFGG